MRFFLQEVLKFVDIKTLGLLYFTLVFINHNVLKLNTALNAVIFCNKRKKLILQIIECIIKAIINLRVDLMKPKLALIAVMLLSIFITSEITQITNNSLSVMASTTEKDVTIHGIVMNEFGNPIIGINIEISPVGDSNVYSTTTDGNGNYSIMISSVLPNNFAIFVTRAGYDDFNAEFTVEDVVESSTERKIDLELKREDGSFFQLEGIVKDYLTGDRVSGATITLWPEEVNSQTDPIATATTDDYGYFYIVESIRNPLTSYYGIEVTKSGYVYYSNVISPNEGVDYTFKEIFLSDSGYSTFYGRVKGEKHSGSIILRNARIIIVLSRTSEILVNTTVDIDGYYYIPIVARPGETFKLFISNSGYITQLFTISGEPGSYPNYVTLNQEPLDNREWFELLFSILKEKGSEFLETFFNDNSNIGTTVSWNIDKDAKIPKFGMPVKIGIDLDITYSDEYEVTLEVVPGPFGNRPGTFVEILIPEIGIWVPIRFGATFRLFDPDKDLNTFNPVLVVDNFTSSIGISLPFSWNFEDYLKSEIERVCTDKQYERIKKMLFVENAIGKFLTTPNGIAIKPKDLSLNFRVESGLRFEFNGLSDEFIPGQIISEFKIFPYVHFGFDIDVDLEAYCCIYIPELFSYSLVEVNLHFCFSSEYNEYPFCYTYYPRENLLKLGIYKEEIKTLSIELIVNWTFINGLFHGTKELLIWEPFLDYESEFLDEITISIETYVNDNLIPNIPQISGPNEINIGDQVEFTFRADDPDLDRILLQIDWGQGDIINSDLLESGEIFEISHSWDEIGDYELKVRSFDGRLYSPYSSMAIRIVHQLSAPIVTFSDYIPVSHSNQYTAQANDAQLYQIRYKFYWSDGGTWTSGWVESGTAISQSHTFYSVGTKNLVVVAENEMGVTMNSTNYEIHITNAAPATPSTPSGPSTGYRNVVYSFSFSSTDPDNHIIKYVIDWNDGTSTTTGYYTSGNTVTVSHSWSSTGGKTIKVKAIDPYGAESAWVSKSISIVNTPPTIPTISGPSSGDSGVSYSFGFTSTDAEGEGIKYTIYWGDGSYYSGFGFYASGVTFTKTHAYSNPGTYSITAKACDESGAWSSLSSAKIFTINPPPNSPPNTPIRPSGPSSGVTGTYYSFSFYSTDPDNDQIKYKIYWGDGSTTTTGYYDSGTTISRSHKWIVAKTFYVKVQVCDSHGLWSGYSSTKYIVIKSSSGGGPIRVMDIGTMGNLDTVDYDTIELNNSPINEMIIPFLVFSNILALMLLFSVIVQRKKNK